ncbi:MAG TPA: hypothetical protein PKV66_06235, partial [Candidatus Pelethenecus sp.]|nr:hypothetical protein [Candidatus Pelethenecus sp.]
SLFTKKGDIFMIYNNFTELRLKDRKNKIQKIIKDKASNLSDSQINSILEKLDINKQYTITSTLKLDILEKNSYQEERCEDGYSYKVKIIPLVGNFKPGLVDVDGQIVPP